MKSKKEAAREKIWHSSCFWSVRNEIEKEAMRFGFLLAFRHKDQNKPMGFGLVIRNGTRSAAIHGVADRACGNFVIKTAYQSKFDSDGTFMMMYLEEFAKLLGIDSSDLLSKLSERGFLWRFQGYVDGLPCRDQDNDDTWQPLWRALKFLNSNRPQLNRVPLWAQKLLFDGLNHAAVEGQIVLDK